MSVTKGKHKPILCQRKRLAGDFADINAVYNIIQQIGATGKGEHRCGYRKYPAADTALRKNQFAANEYSPLKSEQVPVSPALLQHCWDFRQESSKISARYSISRTPFGGRVVFWGSVPVQR